MNAEDLYNQFQKNVTDTLSGAQSISGELQNLLRAAMTKTIAGLDIVSRDEFDAQQAVLLRSREKIDALEQQLTELEALLIIKKNRSM
ncbi:MAG: accessory factor UbiK family protein [Porticoccaceae bacterium]|jgi:BMFP domain-containing protein YqiC|nr:accessory factor UbiK family protein [Porticoccaceae bacterium]MBT7564492.1 accessory factor UbiK family protein [Porticoccaceae bacterium]|tara:strand:- start:377 stop:640 length:264 start_codon:yes stop_codon:yes gene_type:complete